MAWTSDEEKRIQTIENAIAQHGVAIGNLASKRQLNHLLTLVKKENAELKERIEALESQLKMLTNK